MFLIQYNQYEYSNKLFLFQKIQFKYVYQIYWETKLSSYNIFLINILSFFNG